MLSARDAGAAHATKGTLNQNREPWPSVLSRPMLPPNKATICLEMAKPKPVPPNWRSVAWSACSKRLKMCSCNSLGMPLPLSMTSNSNSFSWRVKRSSTSPWAVNLKALSSNWHSTSFTRNASKLTQSGMLGSSSVTKLTGLCGAGKKVARHCAKVSDTLTGAGLSTKRPAWSWEKSKIWLINFSNLSVDWRISLTVSKSLGSSCMLLSNTSLKPKIAFMGVRNS